MTTDFDYAAEAAQALPPLFKGLADDVSAQLAKMDAELRAIGPDPRLADLLERSRAEAAAVRRRIDEVAADAGDRDIDAALGDPSAAKAAATLRAQLESLRSQAAALEERVVGVERRIEADRVESWRRKAAFVEECVGALNRLRADRRERYAEDLRAALGLVGSVSASDGAIEHAISAFTLKGSEFRRTAAAPPPAPKGPPPAVITA